MIVVIPAYEPDEKLLGVVNGFRGARPDFPIVVVNDGSQKSSDPIFAALKAQEGVTVLEHPQNQGKGAALKTAFAYVAAHYPETEGILTVDADGQHLLDDSLAVCAAWEKHPDLIVTGSRRFKGNVPLRSRLGNGITRGVFHMTTGKKLFDTQTGLRAFSVSRVPEMCALHGNRYEYEIHQLLHCCTESTGVFEVPIETVYLNDNSSSHFNTVRDSARIYRVIFRFLGPTFLKFMTTSFLSFLIDLLGFCVFFYGAVTIFGNWETAVSMFSFNREISAEWDAVLRALNPVVFGQGVWLVRLVSLLLARVISSIANFLLNRRFVFGAAKHPHDFGKYALTAVLVLIGNWAIMSLLSLTRMPEWLCFILAQLICYPLSFLLQRTFVFKKGKEKPSNV